MKKLIIWDFDGVIADSEKVWIKNRQKSVNDKFNLNWDFETTNKYLGGISDKTKRQVLDNMGYITDDEFWQEQSKMDIDSMYSEGLDVIPGVEKIIKKIKKQCVATGGIKKKTIIKLELVGFWQKYFDDHNLFTADMVERGKPEPDLFLFAAKKMGEKPEDCIVIEDSIAGITAAQRAGMDVIAFLGAEMYHNNTYIERIKKTGVKNICFDMKEVEKLLLS